VRRWSPGPTGFLETTRQSGVADLTTELLRRAAERGGDVVILQQNNSVESSSVSKKGRALTWTRESRQVSYQMRSGTETPATWPGERNIMMFPHLGNDYRPGIFGRQFRTVWRKDPDLLLRTPNGKRRLPKRRRRRRRSAKTCVIRLHKFKSMKNTYDTGHVYLDLAFPKTMIALWLVANMD